MNEGKIFGKNVKRVRQVKGLTQRELAVKVGLATDTVSNIERGNQENLGMKNMIAICQELSVDLQQLFLEDPASVDIKLVISDKNFEALKEICDKFFK